MPHPLTRVADGTPLGLLAIGTTSLASSLIQIGARGTSLPFLIMPLILFYGGVGNFIAGIMQYINKDTWGATTFITVACYFFQLGYIFVPSSGVLTAYANSPEEFDNALGFVLLSFTIVILIITASSLKTTVFTTASLGTLTVMFVLFTAGRLTHNSDILKAAGWIGIVVAFEVYYAALALMVGRDMVGFDFPVWPYALIGKNRTATVTAVVTEGKIEGTSPEEAV